MEPDKMKIGTLAIAVERNNGKITVRRDDGRVMMETDSEKTFAGWLETTRRFAKKSSG